MPREADPEKGITFQRTPEELAEWNRRFKDRVDQAVRAGLVRAARVKSPPEAGTAGDTPPGNVFREPLRAPEVLHTFIWFDEQHSLFQMQWDYRIEWPAGGTPEIRIYSYRCFQRRSREEEYKLLERDASDVPMTQQILAGITKQAAEILHATATVKGSLQLLPEYFTSGASEAARKRYDLRLYRKMLQQAGTGLAAPSR
jgi:hypothetical protein